MTSHLRPSLTVRTRVIASSTLYYTYTDNPIDELVSQITGLTDRQISWVKLSMATSPSGSVAGRPSDIPYGITLPIR